ncbi:hypothetical protein cyc_06874 [Cyclospora cayetanensis]|uniref:Uncharacterized protein n=1 Tax=Cyclospora cayetanensis TaxID=88456 RepID=A0A1D3D788_9EIME|nr:hypothetical protein cyc_06874 [Cyclospora cayetanensis]
MGEDLDRQLKELQEKEAVEGKALQLQLQHEQQKLQQLLLQQKQISKQMDIEIADSGLAIKGKNTTVAPSARQQEYLRGGCERLCDDFASLLKETISAMESRLNPPVLSEGHTVSSFYKKIEAMQQETLNQIDAFLVDKPPNQTLGAGWRGQGLVPPTAVTKLGV